MSVVRVEKGTHKCVCVCVCVEIKGYSAVWIREVEKVCGPCMVLCKRGDFIRFEMRVVCGVVDGPKGQGAVQQFFYAFLCSHIMFQEIENTKY